MNCDRRDALLTISSRNSSAISGFGVETSSSAENFTRFDAEDDDGAYNVLFSAKIGDDPHTHILISPSLHLRRISTDSEPLAHKVTKFAKRPEADLLEYGYI